MQHLEALTAQLAEDGFTFTPTFDGEFCKIKTPIKGWSIGRKFEHGAIVTVGSWCGTFKKVYKNFDLNGDANKVEEFLSEATKKAEQIKREANENAAIEAEKIWQEATDKPTGSIPYLERKGLQSSLFGARVDSATGCTLIVPVKDSGGKLWGVQRIHASGDKRFVKGMRKEGCYHVIGEINESTKIVYICEGFATSASVYLATNQPTVTAFDAGNLKSVAKSFRERYQRLTIIICGDNDESGVGQRAATAAAREVNGFAKIPKVTGKDWNDCWVEDRDETIKSFKLFEEKIKKEPPKQDRNKLQSILLHDLMTQPDPEYDWLVKDLLIRGGTSSISGAPKSGKSTLTRKLALCMAKGEPFFGRQTTPGKIVYIAVEEKVTEVKKHFKDLKATGNEQIFIHASYIPTELPKQLRELCELIRPDLIICDTFQKVTGIKDINDAGQVNAGMQPFHDIAKDFDTHILMVHHLSKGKNGVEAISGSLAVRAAFDCNMLLEAADKNKKVRVFSSEQRYGVDFEAHKIEFDTITRNPTLGESVAESQLSDRLEDIVSFIRDMDNEEQTYNALYSGIKGSKPLFNKALKFGVKKGWLVERKDKQKKFYSVSSNAPINEGDEY